MKISLEFKIFFIIYHFGFNFQNGLNPIWF